MAPDEEREWIRKVRDRGGGEGGETYAKEASSPVSGRDKSLDSLLVDYAGYEMHHSLYEYLRVRTHPQTSRSATTNKRRKGSPEDDD
jgi:hypothetical protein